MTACMHPLSSLSSTSTHGLDVASCRRGLSANASSRLLTRSKALSSEESSLSLSGAWLKPKSTLRRDTSPPPPPLPLLNVRRPNNGVENRRVPPFVLLAFELVLVFGGGGGPGEAEAEADFDVEVVGGDDELASDRKCRATASTSACCDTKQSCSGGFVFVCMQGCNMHGTWKEWSPSHNSDQRKMHNHNDH